MTVRREQRRGGSRLVIDIPYVNKNGVKTRYRKDAPIQTMVAARAEERRIVALIAQYGEPVELEAPVSEAKEEAPSPAAPPNSPPSPDPSPPSPPPVPTRSFSDVVAEYRATFMLTDLKVSTRRGYRSVLDAILLPRFGALPLTSIDQASAAALDLELSQRKRTQGTRNNVQIVLRSVLRFATSRGYLADAPKGLPRLKPVGQTILEIPTDADVQAILAAAVESHRRSFALMAYAGLRPNEVRALRRRDVRLRWEGGGAVGGFLSVREGWSYGETHTPKTGQREIPIAPPLARLLGPVEQAPRDAHVALNERAKPWGQYGLDQAFERVRNRVGLEDWSVYCLRHYAITAWLRAGIPVHVVQRMAGHRNLSTTQRYVHHLKEDLEEAARRLVGFTEGR
ncbi:site-specific integrase [Polyangium sp. 15x6]|uniref:tyrosine-type recombinase/integrase n=1 Tax=Polyangium sp. 15x6 TaxID=3042687 RepID=UPI002499E652|nr:site-specific integrase [Polyangium sp. 15x6]MDI3292012.1 site-specific integrase [Polyangium sp. 15x6]